MILVTLAASAAALPNVRWRQPDPGRVEGYLVQLARTPGSVVDAVDIGSVTPGSDGIYTFSLGNLEAKAGRKLWVLDEPEIYVSMLAYDSFEQYSSVSNEIRFQLEQCSRDIDCADNDRCDGTETCQSGRCVSGSALSCQASCGGPAACDPLSGCIDDQKASGDMCYQGPPSTSGYSLVAWSNAYRESSSPLDGKSVGDDLYVSVDPSGGIQQVKFFLDGASSAVHTENAAPWDLAGGTDWKLNAFDTTSLPPGSHRLEADLLLSDGRVETLVANFNVGGSATAEPSPPPPSGSDYTIMNSLHGDRSDAYGLAGTRVGGSLYAFVSPESGVRKVRFFIDDGNRSGSPFQIEYNAPWDLGGSDGSEALPVSTSGMNDGWHRVDAEITNSNGEIQIVTAWFEVANGASAPPPPSAPVPETSSFEIQRSYHSDRRSPTNLDGQTVSGALYAFVTPESGVSRVRFFLDDASLSGTPFQTESIAPFDLGGGSVDWSNSVSTQGMKNGWHRLDAEVTKSDGQVQVTTAWFNVAN